MASFSSFSSSLISSSSSAFSFSTYAFSSALADSVAAFTASANSIARASVVAKSLMICFLLMMSRTRGPISRLYSTSAVCCVMRRFLSFSERCWLPSVLPLQRPLWQRYVLRFREHVRQRERCAPLPRLPDQRWCCETLPSHDRPYGRLLARRRRWLA